MKRDSHDQQHKDPVCGMEVSYLTAIEIFDYNGTTYYFCASSCRESFEAEPEKYIHKHRQHGIKARQLAREQK